MSQRHPIQNERIMFITTNTKYREPIFMDATFALAAIESLYFTQQRYPFFLYGFVIMPDHCHILMLIPDGSSVSKTIYAYKRSVAFTIGRGPIWQPRFHMRLVNRSNDALEYIHRNPIHAGLCKKPEEYPWSSACGKWDVSDLDY